MSPDSAIEVRLEVYSDGDFSAETARQLTEALAGRWPETWDVKVPARPSRGHPAEWRAVVPLPDGATAEKLHQLLAAVVLALPGSDSLHFRTRWSFQESPDHQEIYEVAWA